MIRKGRPGDPKGLARPPWILWPGPLDRLASALRIAWPPKVGQSRKYQVWGRPQNAIYFLWKTMNSDKIPTKSEKVGKIAKTFVLRVLGSPWIHLEQGRPTMTSEPNMAQPSLVTPRETAGKYLENYQNQLEARQAQKNTSLGQAQNRLISLYKTMNSVNFSTKSKKVNKITKTLNLDDLGSPRNTPWARMGQHKI